jgi:hypothetical protein
MQTSYRGAQTAASAAAEYNTLQFIIQRVVNRISTATLVQVMSVTNTPGQVTSVGQVDVLPLVNQLDGDGNSTPHQIVHGLPYFRFQGGSNAVLCDPQVNDIGLAVFCQHDIQSVKASKKQSNPGSRRRYDLSDGVYFGLCLSGTPNQYIAFTNSGIIIQDKNNNKIEMSSSGIAMTSSQLTNSGEIIGKFGGLNIHLTTHNHSGVQTGGSNTLDPVPNS